MWTLERVVVTAWLIVLAVGSGAHGQAPPGATVVAACDFEGPYSAGENQVQDGCGNNWQWGRKDMTLRADRDSGRPGTTQQIRVRGISSGGMQFFYVKLKLKQDHYYRIGYWLKTDGLEGPLRCYVRKIDYPWTEYLHSPYEMKAEEWRQYTFTGKCAANVDEDVGVCWECGSLGALWLDDLKVEESAEPFPAPAVAPLRPEREGNLLPRPSCEGRRDPFWSTMFFGAARDGVWEGVEGDWEDPQAYRAEGGKIGRWCMAVPSATHAGQAGTLSIPVAVRPGRPYTLSLWMKASEVGYPGSAALLYWLSGQHFKALGAAYPKLTTKWQRVSFTVTPQPPPGSADATSPVTVVIQIAPAMYRQGVVFVDGLQLEAAEQPGDYRPGYPLELYADIGQDGGNLLEWGRKVPLNILAASAGGTGPARTRIEVTVTGYPDRAVWRKTLSLTVDRETPVTLDLARRGLCRVSLRPVNATEAAPQELLLALVPPPRNTGLAGMFGTHIAIRPALVSYIRRLGFTWTRLHDCSLLTKWSAGEREPGKLLWHDEVVDGVLKCGIHLLGLPDHPPAWAEVKGDGQNPVDVAAYGRYCEAVARHYAGRIDHWELWNEPYMPGSYAGGPQRFGELMQAGYAALKRGNPQARVLGWCADVGAPAWGASIPDEARRCLDIFSFHNYINNLSGGGTLPFAAELPDHQKLLPPEVTECWNTEGTNGAVCANSFYTNPLLYDRDRNARATAFASRVWVEHLKAGVGKFFVYQMHNVDTMMYNGGYQSLLIGYDRTPTPAAVAAATTAYCIDGLRAVPCNGLPGVVQGLFGGGRAAWVVYDDAGVVGRRKLRLATLPRDVQVHDVMGNDPRQDAARDWEIGINPLFVLSTRLGPAELAAACRKAVMPE